MDGTRPVSFRLSSNISNFIEHSIAGHYNGALIAIAKCLNTHSVDHWIRPALWDVFYKAAENEPDLEIMNPVKEAVSLILNRINGKFY